MSAFKSEVRDSIIDELLEKAANRNFGKYLSKINIQKIRGIENQLISFDFPVTAIIGTNGGGKTTLIGAAAIAYKIIQPKKYFARSGNLDNDMQNWGVQYDLIDRSVNPKDIVRRTANFRRFKWNRDPLERTVIDFGVSRTVPPIEKNDFNRFANSKRQFEQDTIYVVDTEVSRNVSRILGKDISKFRAIKFSQMGQIDFLAGVNEKGTQYSEFHFGAGESSVIRMVTQIESLPENSLVLIEEIENGLHPVATTKMVEYLIDVAHRKKIQTIFTTHSNDALRPLPAKAIWASINGSLFQGKLDIHSLRTITGQIDCNLAIFTEDKFSKYWIEAILRGQPDIAMDSIEVHYLSGDGNAVQMNTFHNANPSVKFPSICFIDGDSSQKEGVKEKVFRLPGESPENYIYNSVLEKIDEYKIILATALHRRPEEADKIEAILREIRISNRDPHLLFSSVGMKLGLIPEEIIMRGFMSVWVYAYPDKCEEILQLVRSYLPIETKAKEELSTLF